jgi:hypothetical protein
MKTREPEMFRMYLWQELIKVKLKDKDCKEKISELATIENGKFYLPSKILGNLASKSDMSNTLSRKDYMFCNNRLLAKIDEIDEASAYI